MDARRFRTLFSLSLLIVDSAMLTLAFVAGYYLRKVINWPTPAVDIGGLSTYAVVLGLNLITILAVFFLLRLYHLGRSSSRVDEFYAVVAGLTGGTLLYVALTVLLLKNNSIFEFNLARLMIGYTWLSGVVLVTLGRLVLHQLRWELQIRGVAAERVIVLGSGEWAQLVVQKIRGSPFLGYELLGVVNGGEAPAVEGVPGLGRPADISHLIDTLKVDEIIIAVPNIADEELVELISLCHRERVSIKVFPSLFDIMATGVSIDDLGGLPLLNIRDVALRGWNMAFKRAIDIVGSALGLICLSPFLLLLAIVVKLDSRGPAFFIQERMGLDGQLFPMIKFRSMRSDAEVNGPGWTVKDDPRRTRLGTLLRRLSLDELPQLINVFLGEMSLVGPRPEQPAFVDQFRRKIPRYMERHREKAGCTGWAQVNGLRGDTSIEERTKYDLWYIENWSVGLDFKIILRQLLKIFFDRSAY